MSDEDLDLPREFIIPEPMSPGYDPDLDDEEEDEAPLNENQLALEPCNTVDRHPSAGIFYGDVPDYDDTELHKNPWKPFKSGEDFQQAARFVEAGTPKIHINRHFNEGGCKNPGQLSFSSGKTLYQQIAWMEKSCPPGRPQLSVIVRVVRGSSTAGIFFLACNTYFASNAIEIRWSLSQFVRLPARVSGFSTR